MIMDLNPYVFQSIASRYSDCAIPATYKREDRLLILTPKIISSGNFILRLDKYHFIKISCLNFFINNFQSWEPVDD
jgi:hypothetical protein